MKDFLPVSKCQFLIHLNYLLLSLSSRSYSRLVKASLFPHNLHCVLRNSLEEFNSRLELAGEGIRKLENIDRVVQAGEQRE